MALSGNAGAISQFLANKGLSSAGVAGVLGGMQAESGLDPTSRNSASGATGIAQWLGPRLTSLENLAASMGTSVSNLDAQLEYWWQEMSSPQYAGLLHELQTTTNPQQAARDYVSVFERPGPGGDPGAPGYAQTFYGGGVPGGSGNPSAGGSGGVQNADSGGLPWWLDFFTPWGPLVTGKHPLLPGTQSFGQVFGGILSDLGTALNMFMDLFRPSFWLRVGAFLLGLICLIGGFVALVKGTSL